MVKKRISQIGDNFDLHEPGKEILQIKENIFQKKNKENGNTQFFESPQGRSV